MLLNYSCFVDPACSFVASLTQRIFYFLCNNHVTEFQFVWFKSAFIQY